MSFKTFRIAILLLVLALAAATHAWEQYQVRSWAAPLDVGLYPVNGDGSAATAAYVSSLTPAHFEEIDRFLSSEAERYGVRFSPAMRMTLHPTLDVAPPLPQAGQGALANVLWSLKMRWWVYRHTSDWLPQLGKIKVFILYHLPEEGVGLEHSLGLQKGLIGVIHAFANPQQNSQNNIVIAHELLHTLGATDKYDQDGRPIYPIGYAEPDQPQSVRRYQAEIMAGRLVDGAGRAVMPMSLEQCLIGPTTAHEINFGAGFRRSY